MTIDYAARARALVGTRFRPQGRSGEGLDCVGVVLATFDIPVAAVPRGYRLRQHDLAAVTETLLSYFHAVSIPELASGDLLVLAPAADQVHFAVRTDGAFVHAHAGIRRIVETPGLPQWKQIGAWRRGRG